MDLAASRRRLAIEAAGILAAPVAFGLVYGLAARQAGLTLVESLAMSVFVLAGASQFAAVGLLDAGAGWLVIVLLTAALNARHLLYGAAMAPLMAHLPRWRRALLAYLLVDEVFGLSLAQAKRLGGRFDTRGYLVAAAFICLPWPIATAAGHLGAAAIGDPARLGLDVVFPAAMAGLAVALMTGRRDVVAATAGVAAAVVVGLAVHPSAGVVAGGLLGPLAGLALQAREAGA